MHIGIGERNMKPTLKDLENILNAKIPNTEKLICVRGWLNQQIDHNVNTYLDKQGLRTFRIQKKTTKNPWDGALNPESAGTDRPNP